MDRGVKRDSIGSSSDLQSLGVNMRPLSGAAVVVRGVNRRGGSTLAPAVSMPDMLWSSSKSSRAIAIERGVKMGASLSSAAVCAATVESRLIAYGGGWAWMQVSESWDRKHPPSRRTSACGRLWAIGVGDWCGRLVWAIGVGECCGRCHPHVTCSAPAGAPQCAP